MNETQANQLFEQAIAELQTGKPAAAETILKKLDKAIPSNVGIIYYLGVAASLLGRKEQAIGIYDRVIRLNPKFIEAYNNKGLDLTYLGNYIEATASFESAIQLRPDFIEAYQNLGVAFNELKLYEKALHTFLNALHLSPNNADVLTGMGSSLIGLKRYTDAEDVLRKAIEIDNNNSQAHYNLGVLYSDTQKYVDCISAYSKSLKLDNHIKWLQGLLLFAKMQICDWNDYSTATNELLCSVNNKTKCATPFTLLGLPSSLAEQKLCAEIYTNSKYSPPTQRAKARPKPNQDRIKIAYCSADFFNHATAYLMAELLELHDRSRFEIIGVCYGRSPSDKMRNRLAKSFDKFFEVANQSDQEIAKLIQDMEVDIAVDLKGHTQDSRLGIFASRPAPIQIHYLGYPGTIGASFIDYLIADPVLVPEQHRQFYKEKIVYLPDSYQVNDRLRSIGPSNCSRHILGLPEQGFVFCCFNNNWKITPDIFDLWMSILKQVDGSVLWLFKDNDAAANNLMQEAKIRGIEPDRLVFAEKLPLEQHLARLKHADLFLDTIHCNAHTTASDALWAGLPVLTKIGDTYASRVASSLLKAIGLPELISHSLKEYETMAIGLATNVRKINAIKQKLSDNRLSTPLFDTPRFTKNLESAYQQMMQRHQVGLSPDHIFVQKNI